MWSSTTSNCLSNRTVKLVEKSDKSNFIYLYLFRSSLDLFDYLRFPTVLTKIAPTKKIQGAQRYDFQPSCVSHPYIYPYLPCLPSLYPVSFIVLSRGQFLGLVILLTKQLTSFLKPFLKTLLTTNFIFLEDPHMVKF